MSPRRFLQRHLPQRHFLTGHRHLGMLGARLHDPQLWHLTRRATAGAVALGLFVAFLPLPLHMLIAALLAVAMRVNLPVAVLAVWVTNPLTMPPAFYAAYRLGAWLLDLPAREQHFAFSWDWFTETALAIWKPLLLGSVIIGTVAALTGYLAVHLSWRLHVVRRWRARR